MTSCTSPTSQYACIHTGVWAAVRKDTESPGGRDSHRFFEHDNVTAHALEALPRAWGSCFKICGSCE